MTDISNKNFIAYGFNKCSPHEAPWVTGFEGDPYSVKPYFWGGRPILNGMPSFIRPDHNNYICVSTFKPSADGTWHRSKNNFSAMHVVMIDDIGTKILTNRIILKPSVLVETSPGNYQAWYFLDPPITDPVKADMLIKGMIENGLTADSKDPGMRGVTRYGRLPDGSNAKAKYVEKLGKPFQQRTTHWSPTTKFSAEEIAYAYNVDLNKVVAKKHKQLTSPLLSQQLQRIEADLQCLSNAGLYIEAISSLTNAHRIVCPWLSEHTDEEPSGTVFFESSEDNAYQGGFKCHHGHCTHRTMADLRYFLNRLMQAKGGK